MSDVLRVASSINSPEFHESIFLAKLIFGAVGILFVVFTFFLVWRTSWIKFAYLFDLAEILSFRPYGLGKMTRAWKRVRARLETENEAEYKLAVLGADSLLGETLKRMGFTGDTVEEQLNKVRPTVIPNVEDLKAAHRIRNNIVHDPDYRLTYTEARRVIDIYEKAFGGLDLI